MQCTYPEALCIFYQNGLILFLVGSLMTDIIIPSTKRLLLHLKVVLVEVSTFHTSTLFQSCCLVRSESHSKILETYF